MLSIKGVWIDGGVVHTPFLCSCGWGECFHMLPDDVAAVKDSLRQEAGMQPLGYLTSDERTLLTFRAELESTDFAQLLSTWSSAEGV